LGGIKFAFYTRPKEALPPRALAIATAAKNSGGFVIAQVERIADRGTLNARQVKIPVIMVDCTFVSQPQNHCQVVLLTIPRKTFSSLIKNLRQLLA
jgi:propionate CoA-transferase